MNFVETFCLTVAKKIVEELFGVSFKFGYRKNLCTRGVCHDILSKISRLTVPKKLFMNLSCFSYFGNR